MFPLICIVLCNHKSIVKENLGGFFNLAICSLLSSLVGFNVTVFLRVLKYNARQVPQGVPLLRCSSFLYKKSHPDSPSCQCCRKERISR